VSHPTLSGFFPTQTCSVPFIFLTDLQTDNGFIAFCWTCLQFAEPFLRALQGSPFLGGRPPRLSPRRSNTRALLSLGRNGRNKSWFWFEDGKTWVSLPVCPAAGLRSHACSLPPPLQPPAGSTRDRQPQGRSWGDASRRLGAAWGPRWVHMWLPCSESFPGEAQHEASSATEGLPSPLRGFPRHRGASLATVDNQHSPSGDKGTAAMVAPKRRTTGRGAKSQHVAKGPRLQQPSAVLFRAN